MADTSDDKKAAEGATGDAAYDVLEKDFQEVCMADHCLHLAFQSFFWNQNMFTYLLELSTSRALQVLLELQRDKSLERFRAEYEKLFKAVRKSHGKYCTGFPC